MSDPNHLCGNCGWAQALPDDSEHEVPAVPQPESYRLECGWFYQNHLPWALSATSTYMWSFEGGSCPCWKEKT